MSRTLADCAVVAPMLAEAPKVEHRLEPFTATLVVVRKSTGPA